MASGDGVHFIGRIGDLQKRTIRAVNAFSGQCAKPPFPEKEAGRTLFRLGSMVGTSILLCRKNAPKLAFEDAKENNPRRAWVQSE